MQSRSRQLIRIAFLSFGLSCAVVAASAETRAQLTANLIWKGDAPWFGGFSGAEVTQGGAQITLLTDKGKLVYAEMRREMGQLKRLQVTKVSPVRHPMGQPIGGQFADAEGIAIGPGGQTFLSFEQAQRVVRMDPKTQTTIRLPDHPDFDRMARNKQLEALAIHPNGTLFTLAERVPANRKTFPLYAFSNDTWRVSHQIPRRGPFLMVGADFDDRGQLYLLERAVSPLGFRSRIRRFDLNAPDLGETQLMISSPGRFDNLEALSVWRDPKGNIRLTLVSDDNFLRIQRTQIVEFTLTE